jgi:hypothetical protein
VDLVENFYGDKYIIRRLFYLIDKLIILFFVVWCLIVLKTKIGHWHSWKKDGLDIQDIVWPGHSHVPPEDGPEKFHLKVAFLEEPPFISIVPPDPVSGRCPVSHGVPCHVGNHVPLNGSDFCPVYFVNCLVNVDFKTRLCTLSTVD